MDKPHYREKWFQALVMMCLILVLLGVTRPEDPEGLELAKSARNSFVWILGPFFFGVFYMCYGVVSLIHWILSLEFNWPVFFAELKTGRNWLMILIAVAVYQVYDYFFRNVSVQSLVTNIVIAVILFLLYFLYKAHQKKHDQAD